MPSREPVLFEFVRERYADNLGPVLEIVAEKEGPHAREGGSRRTRVPDLVKRDPKVFQKNDARRHGDPFPRDTGRLLCGAPWPQRPCMRRDLWTASTLLPTPHRPCAEGDPAIVGQAAIRARLAWPG